MVSNGLIHQEMLDVLRNEAAAPHPDFPDLCEQLLVAYYVIRARLETTYVRSTCIRLFSHESSLLKYLHPVGDCHRQFQRSLSALPTGNHHTLCNAVSLLQQTVKRIERNTEMRVGVIDDDYLFTLHLYQYPFLHAVRAAKLREESHQPHVFHPGIPTTHLTYPPDAGGRPEHDYLHAQ